MLKLNSFQVAAELVMREIETLRPQKKLLLIAIDGRCASGKSTLAEYLQKSCGGNVLHMDHFFLRPEQRTVERLTEPGGNVDYERFLAEALTPLLSGKAFAYRPYNCQSQAPGDEVHIAQGSVSIIEGSYSCHPALGDNYDLRIFMSVDKDEQLRRIRRRNGEISALTFQEKWIPLEEKYFSAYGIEEKCDIRVEVSGSFSG